MFKIISNLFNFIFSDSKTESKADYYAFLLQQAKPTELDPFQKAHNLKLDMEIAYRAKMRKIKKEHNDMMIKKWEEYREKELAKDQNKYIPRFCPGLDFTEEPHVIGIRYTL